MDDKKNGKPTPAPAVAADPGPGAGITLRAPGGALLVSGRLATGLTPKDLQKALLRGGVKVSAS